MFTWREISSDWLGGTTTCGEHDAIIDAFNRVERVLGRPWMNWRWGAIRGVAATLEVVRTGALLKGLDGVSDSERLVDGIRRGDRSLIAEAEAIRLVLRLDPTAQVELEPEIQSGRRPDFRVRRPGEGWVYVEVTSPEKSDAQRRVEAAIERLVNAPEATETTRFAIEVFLAREPDDLDVARIEQALLALQGLAESDKVDLEDGLGTIFYEPTATAEFVVDDHGRDPVPRLSTIGFAGIGDDVLRRIAVRIPFADGRAEVFLATEARQLPMGEPTLIMVQLGRAAGGWRSWEPALRRRFQRNQHTRVGAVCLFGTAITPNDEGPLVMADEARIVENPHASTGLPGWLTSGLARFAGH